MIFNSRIHKIALHILVRLVNGSSTNEGRLEVYYSGRWGTVCTNNGWSDEYASLVCAQLGFRSGKSADFGPGSGVVLLELVMCSINNTLTASCNHYGVGITVGCGHPQDVGVKCNGMNSGIPEIFRIEF